MTRNAIHEKQVNNTRQEQLQFQLDERSRNV